MKTKVMLVTPAMAKKWLDECNTENRPLNQSRVLTLKSDIESGAWVLTHQGIAFDVRGVLVDGQTRLAAIVAANKAVHLMVTTDLPVEQDRNGTGKTMKTMDAIDRGQVRSTAQQLRLAHGYANANQVAAAAKAVRDICVGSNSRSMSTPQCLFVLELFGKDIEAMLSVSWPKACQRSSILGTLAFARGVSSAKVDEFAWSLASMSNIPAKSPVLALNRWNMNHGASHQSSTQRVQFCRVVASCVKKYIEGGQVEKVIGSEEAMEWFRSKQRTKVAQVASVCGY